MNLVRSIVINRSRSELADLSDPLNSAWKVVFELRPAPAGVWDQYFTDAVCSEHLAKTLHYKHVLVERRRRSGYLHDPTKWDLTKRFVRRLFRRGAVEVIVTCPANAEDLNAAVMELARLTTEANRIYAQSEANQTEFAIAEKVAQKRLNKAIGTAGVRLRDPKLLRSPKQLPAVSSQTVNAR